MVLKPYMRLPWSVPFVALQLGVVIVLFPGPAQGQVPDIPAAELVRRTVDNETKPIPNPPKFMFRDEKKTAGGTQTRLFVETEQAMVGITLANDGKALSPEEREAELKRIQHFVDDPEALRRKHTREKEDAERTVRIVRALPEAFVYEYGETTAGTKGVGKPGDPLVRLNFRPKPDYQPPSRVEQVLTGMQGYLLIDAKQNRIAKIDGVLIKEVGFGWGILGHLDRGGHFLVEQSDAGQGQWEITHMGLGFTGKLLFFKSLNIQSEETFSNFQPISKDLTFAQGIELLKKEAEKPAPGLGPISCCEQRR
jgi:hypothetical protein